MGEMLVNSCGIENTAAWCLDSCVIFRMLSEGGCGCGYGCEGRVALLCNLCRTSNMDVI